MVQARHRTTDTRSFRPLSLVPGVYELTTRSACQPRPQAYQDTIKAHTVRGRRILGTPPEQAHRIGGVGCAPWMSPDRGSRHWAASPSTMSMRLFVEFCLIGLIAS